MIVVQILEINVVNVDHIRYQSCTAPKGDRLGATPVQSSVGLLVHDVRVAFDQQLSFSSLTNHRRNLNVMLFHIELVELVPRKVVDDV